MKQVIHMYSAFSAAVSQRDYIMEKFNAILIYLNKQHKQVLSPGNKPEVHESV